MNLLVEMEIIWQQQLEESPAHTVSFLQMSSKQLHLQDLVPGEEWGRLNEEIESLVV